jgi:hypothetical protein
MIDDADTRKTFAAMLSAVIVGIYGKQAPDVAATRMWFLALQRYELEQIRDALSRHVADPVSGQYPPRPADIVRQIDGSPDTAASLAWSDVCRAMRLVGAYSSVVFSDPAIHAAITDLGGWPALCHTPDDEMPFLARRFEAAYTAHRSSGVGEYPAVLAGIHEQQQRAMGYSEHVQPPRLIGDEAACRRVLAGGTDGLLLGTRQLGRETMASALERVQAILSASDGGSLLPYRPDASTRSTARACGVEGIPHVEPRSDHA